MIIAILVVVGLCFGSFVNALVWRLHEQAEVASKLSRSEKNPSKKTRELRVEQQRLSVLKGRSMCPDCHHELAAVDMVPVISWLALRGRCRYCGHPIMPQYPLVELVTAGLFVASYIWWPVAFGTAQTAIFALWLLLITGLMALLVYDIRWKLLPSRLIYPLSAIATFMAITAIATAHSPWAAVLNAILAVAVGGGLFYALFQASSGKWIGGGDVRLGFLLGLVAITPARSFLFIFLAALLGSLLSLPLLATKRLKRNSTIPFGPFLIIALIVVQLFGTAILNWYQRVFIGL